MSAYDKKEKEEIVRELKEALGDYEKLVEVLSTQIEENKALQSQLTELLGHIREPASEQTDLKRFLLGLDSQEAFDSLSLEQVSRLLPISVEWIEGETEVNNELLARGCAFLLAAMGKWRKELFEQNTENSLLFKRLGKAFEDRQKFAPAVADNVITESELDYCIGYFCGEKKRTSSLESFAL